MPIKVLFDWGNTLMRDFPEFNGPMAHWPRVEIIPGLAEALEQLHGRFVCCVATNAEDSDSELLGLALDRVGIRQYFDHFFISRELGVAKPDQAFFREILRRLKAEPSECIMVGNDYQMDIVPAKRVGLRTIWFTQTTRVDTAPDADEMIYSMDDLVDAVERIAV